MNYTTLTPVDEPVEVRIDTAARKYTLTAFNKNGLVMHVMTGRSNDTSEALSNLQSKEAFPRKAVPGWQAEVIAYCAAGLGKIVEVR